MRATQIRLLDVTRIMRRAGRLPTGVDRVERAYLRRLLAEPEPLFGLARSRIGYLLLDRAGLAGLQQRLEAQVDWGPVDLLSRLGRSGRLEDHKAEADLRRLALARCLPQRLRQMLKRHLPGAICYLNLGHSNLTDRVLHVMRHHQGARIVVMIHDTIPLDYPQFQRAGSVPRFRQMLQRVGRHADLILCNSQQTAADLRRHLAEVEPFPELAVAPLGVEPPAVSQPVQMPTGFDPARPYFLTLGTIEPRKNHLLLLDVWEALAATPAPTPQLLICGSRGWNNEAVFARLDALPPEGPVFEMAGLSDGQIAGLTDGAAAVLFPSLAEGYGLPPLEAAARGARVFCNNLQIFHELLGNNAVYLQGNDKYSWTITLAEVAHKQQANHQDDNAGLARFMPPDWDGHFAKVLKLL